MAAKAGTKNQLKMAEFQLVQVGKVGKRSV